MRASIRRCFAPIFGLVVCVRIGPAAAAPNSFYAGKTLTIIVSSPAGGGYDAVARVLARFLPDHIPGRPNVIVQNMPGAGGITAMNYLYATAARDGTTVGSVQNSVPFEPLFGTKQAQYDPRKFAYLGSPNVETDVLIAWRGAKVRSLADVRKRVFTLGSTGAKSNPSIWATLLNQTLGLKLKPVVGYPGQKDILLGMQRGEIEGTFIFLNSLNAARPDWVRDKDVRILVQIGGAIDPQIKNVPFAENLVKGREDKLLVREAAAPLSLGRPYLLPPGAPKDRVALLRRAFLATFHDPRFTAQLTKLHIEATAPKSGEQIQRIIADAYAAPPQIRDRLVEIINPGAAPHKN